MTDKKKTSSDIELPVVARASENSKDTLPLPGEYPYTRGIYADMYRGRLWTMRQYAGYGTAE